MSKQFKYEQIVHSIEEKIYQKIIVVGEKLPSIRAACNELSVSPSTIFKAYYELETRGLIEARNKSGYYVSLNGAQQKKLNQKDEQIKQNLKPLAKAKNVDEMIQELEQSKLGDIEVDFSSGSPSIDMLPIQKINKSIRSSTLTENNKHILYEDPHGSIELRKLILSKMLTTEKMYHVEDLVITAGCLEAVNICLNILLKTGDSILTDTSNYYYLLSLVKNLDIKVHIYPFNTNVKFDENEFEKVLKKKRIKVCLLTSNFHNPTGLSFSNETKKKIVTIATKNKVSIIEDDVYSDLYFGKRKPFSLKHFDTEGIVYYCSSFSKTLVPGFRIGYCIPGSKTEEFAKYKRLISFTTNSISQAAIVHFMKTSRYDFHLKSLRKKLHLNMLKYGDALIQYFPSSVKFNIPKGGYVFWIEFPIHFDSYLFYRKVLEERILLTPGEIFSTNGFYKNFIRISYSEPYTEKIEKALKRIGELAHFMLNQ